MEASPCVYRMSRNTPPPARWPASFRLEQPPPHKRSQTRSVLPSSLRAPHRRSALGHLPPRCGPHLRGVPPSRLRLPTSRPHPQAPRPTRRGMNDPGRTGPGRLLPLERRFPRPTIHLRPGRCCLSERSVVWALASATFEVSNSMLRCPGVSVGPTQEARGNPKREGPTAGGACTAASPGSVWDFWVP